MKGKETLKNQDKEAFIEEVNKLPFGKIFSKFFVENTDPKGRILDLDKKEITGKIPVLPKYYRMVLLNSKQMFFSTDLKTGEISTEFSPLGIEVYSYKKEPLITFHLIPSEIADQGYEVDLHIEEETFSLSPQNKDGLLLDMISNFRQKISEYQVEKSKGANDTEGAGSC